MVGDLQRAVGRNLRRLRRKRELTKEDVRRQGRKRYPSQEKFAEVVGIHRTYMGAIERGERNLTLKVVERIAETMNVDPHELLRDERQAGANYLAVIRKLYAVADDMGQESGRET